MIRLLQRLLTREGSIAPILVAGKASIRLVRPGGVCLLVLFFLVGTSNWAQQPAEYGSNFDRRLTMTPAPVARQAPGVQALERLRDSLDGSLLETFDSATGVTRTMWNPVGTLTPPTDGEPLEVALAFVRSNMDSIGLQQGDLEFEVCDQVHSKISDTHHLYL